MPELAEVETIRADVERQYTGRRITAVDVTGLRSVRRHEDPAQFVGRVRGATVVGTGRRGKYLLVHLDHGDVVVAHMGMSGQLLCVDSDAGAVRHTHVRLGFDRGPDLRFVDPRTFGQMFVTGPDVPELAHLGFDPLGPSAAADVSQMLDGRPTRLKPLLMDQTRVAGIGNMYADEILHVAGLRPDRPAATVSAAEAAALHRAMVDVLEEAIAMRGSSLADEQYRDLSGRTGRYQERHRVYAREGLACPRCGAAVVRVRGNGRSSYFCPACQR
jgi:formamidopyrimidine-DNA glycosylase